MKNGTNPFANVQLVEDPSMVVKVVKRVPGGYMNRWLIRAEVLEPRLYARFFDGRLHAHPAIIAKIKAELAAVKGPANEQANAEAPLA